MNLGLRRKRQHLMNCQFISRQFMGKTAYPPRAANCRLGGPRFDQCRHWYRTMDYTKHRQASFKADVSETRGVSPSGVGGEATKLTAIFYEAFSSFSALMLKQQRSDQLLSGLQPLRILRLGYPGRQFIQRPIHQMGKAFRINYLEFPVSYRHLN